MAETSEEKLFRVESAVNEISEADPGRGFGSTIIGFLETDWDSHNYHDLEKHKLQASKGKTSHNNASMKLTAWMVVNTLATIGIVGFIYLQVVLIMFADVE